MPPITPHTESRALTATNLGAYSSGSKSSSRRVPYSHEDNLKGLNKYLLARKHRLYEQISPKDRKRTVLDQWKEYNIERSNELNAITKTQSGSYRCGFCGTGDHELCPVGLRNGNGSLLRCSCPCNSPQDRRCLRCGEKGTIENISPDWICYLEAECSVRVAKLIAGNPIHDRIDRAYRAAKAERVAQAKQRAKQREATYSARGGTPDCLCGCGGTTRGGLFQPGHDSRYMSKLLNMDRAEALQLAEQVSDAFARKLVRHFE